MLKVLDHACQDSGLVDIDTQCNLSFFCLPQPMQAAENHDEDDETESEQEEPQSEDADSSETAQVMLCCSGCFCCDDASSAVLILTLGFPVARHHLNNVNMTIQYT